MLLLLFLFLTCLRAQDLMRVMTVESPRSQSVGVACKSPGGILNHGGQCTCCPGYQGPQCDQHDACFGITCQNGGTCDRGQCVCPDTHTGDRCQYPSCSFNGRWDTNHCACKMGFGGDQCEHCAIPTPHKAYVCVPTKSTAFDGYMLMQLPTAFAEKIVSGTVKPDSSIPYTGIRPGTIGHNGKKYGCDCRTERNAKRISNAEISLYNLIVTQCIEESTLNAQQMEELQNFWYTCLSLQEQGLLTNAWYIVAIVFIVFFVLSLMAIVIYCIVVNYNKISVPPEESDQDDEYGRKPLVVRSRVNNHIYKYAQRHLNK